MFSPQPCLCHVQWKLDTTSGALTCEWINSDGTAPPCIPIFTQNRTSHNYSWILVKLTLPVAEFAVTGDLAAFQDTFGPAQEIVSGLLLRFYSMLTRCYRTSRLFLPRRLSRYNRVALRVNIGIYPANAVLLLSSSMRCFSSTRIVSTLGAGSA